MKERRKAVQKRVSADRHSLFERNRGNGEGGVFRKKVTEGPNYEVQGVQGEFFYQPPGSISLNSSIREQYS